MNRINKGQMGLSRRFLIFQQVGLIGNNCINLEFSVLGCYGLRFTWRMKMLTGRRGVAILYAYMLLGLGFLRTAAPDFGELTSQEQQLEGTFR